MYATGTPTNAAQFGESTLFGSGLASGRSITTPAATTATSASSTTGMGFTDLTKGHKAPHQAPMQAITKIETPQSSGAKPTDSNEWGKPPGRSDEFATGSSNSRVGNDAPATTTGGEIAEDAEGVGTVAEDLAGVL